MILIHRILYLLPIICILQANIEQLEKYKELLEFGTLQGQDGRFWKNPKSRYFTFNHAFELFMRNNGRVVVELGTSRSFVHGGLPGCNSDDVQYWQPNNPAAWDWGAGIFTRVAAECLQEQYTVFHTVDLAAAHIARCKVITKPFADKISYHVSSSQNFLNRFVGQIDLLYLDTGDMTPIEPTAQLQLEEAKIIVERNLIAPNGLILIDDVKNTTPQKFGETSDLGKSKYSLPYLLEHGFVIIDNEYQVLLQKK